MRFLRVRPFSLPCQCAPEGTQRAPEGTQRAPEGTQRATEGPQRLILQGVGVERVRETPSAGGAGGRRPSFRGFGGWPLSAWDRVNQCNPSPFDG